MSELKSLSVELLDVTPVPVGDKGGRDDGVVGSKSGVSWGALLAASGAVAAYVLHACGHALHETYLSLFGVDPGAFPRSLDAIAVLGQFAVSDRSMAVLTDWAFADGAFVAKVFAFIFCYFFVCFLMMRWLVEWKALDKFKVMAQEKKLRAWLVNFSVSFLGACGGTFALPLAAVFLFLITWLPLQLGQAAALSVYKSQMAVFVAGCDVPAVARSSSMRCFELRKADAKLAKGFLIDSSTTHVAVFDVDLMQARVLERAGTELRVVALAGQK